MGCLAGVGREEEWGVECVQEISDAVADVLMLVSRWIVALRGGRERGGVWRGKASG